MADMTMVVGGATVTVTAEKKPCTWTVTDPPMTGAGPHAGTEPVERREHAVSRRVGRGPAAMTADLTDALVAASLATIGIERLATAHHGRHAQADRGFREWLVAAVELDFELDLEEVHGYAIHQIQSTEHAAVIAQPQQSDLLLEKRDAWIRVRDLARDAIFAAAA